MSLRRTILLAACLLCVPACLLPATSLADTSGGTTTASRNTGGVSPSDPRYAPAKKAKIRGGPREQGGGRAGGAAHGARQEGEDPRRSRDPAGGGSTAGRERDQRGQPDRPHALPLRRRPRELQGHRLRLLRVGLLRARRR